MKQRIFGLLAGQIQVTRLAPRGDLRGDLVGTGGVATLYLSVHILDG